MLLKLNDIIKKFVALNSRINSDNLRIIKLEETLLNSQTKPKNIKTYHLNKSVEEATNNTIYESSKKPTIKGKITNIL